MNDVFISYSHKDLKVAKRLEATLLDVGFSIWRDDRGMVPGDTIDEAVLKAIKESTCVLVLWSKNSVSSNWVLVEASEALKKKKLIQAQLDPSELPIRFRETHAADMMDWRRGVKSLIRAINEAKEEKGETAGLPSDTGWKKRTRRLVVQNRVGLVALLLIIGGLTLWLAFFRTPLFPNLDSRMVFIESGIFPMGTDLEISQEEMKDALKKGIPPDTIKDWALLESPIHNVLLNSFAIDQYEVTFGEFSRYYEKKEIALPKGIPRAADDHPVSGVTWNEARDYCIALGMDLPTEAQWEKAARNGDNRIYPWGNEQVTARHANYCDKSCIDVFPPTDADDGYETTAPVNLFELGAIQHAQTKDGKPDRIFNLAGNVSEWVRDQYDPDVYQNSAEDDPLELCDGVDNCAVRGGSYLDAGYLLRSAFRSSGLASDRFDARGFRCVKEIFD